MATLLGRFARIAPCAGLFVQSALRQVNVTICSRWRLYSFEQENFEFPNQHPVRAPGCASSRCKQQPSAWIFQALRRTTPPHPLALDTAVASFPAPRLRESRLKSHPPALMS
jgi:hypothetical protein